jgi:hypothetical protein
MIRFIMFVSALVLIVSTADAQDVKTPPYRTEHKETGEPGVWIPIWLQQEHLQTEGNLETCEKEGVETKGALDERTREAEASKKAAAELKVSNASLIISEAAAGARADDAEDSAETRLVWAWTSTGVAAVAISVVVILLGQD